MQDWAVKYDQDEPVPPRYDVNAPDLYIPSKKHQGAGKHNVTKMIFNAGMALVTYVLLSGYLLGLRNE